jgi:hypothetical protein
MILQWDESFDIGSDTLTGVNDADYTPPFPLTGKLNKLTIKWTGSADAVGPAHHLTRNIHCGVLLQHHRLLTGIIGEDLHRRTVQAQHVDHGGPLDMSDSAGERGFKFM